MLTRCRVWTINAKQLLSVNSNQLAVLAFSFLVDVLEMKRVILTRVHVLEVVLQPLGPTTRNDFNVAADEVLVDQVAMGRRNRERVILRGTGVGIQMWTT